MNFVLQIPLTVILLSIHFLFPILGEQLHDHMTNEETEKIFRVKHDAINTLQYEVVPVVAKFVHSEKSGKNAYHRSSVNFPKQSVYMEIFGENFDLYLEENNNILFGEQTPIIEPYMDSHGDIRYDRRSYDLIPQLNMGIYRDRKRRAAFTVYEDNDGRINVNGVLNDTFVIRSIPKRLHEEVFSRYLSKPLHILNETGNIHNHIVIKRNVLNDPEYIKHRSILSQSKTGRRDPRISSLNYNNEFTVYPKILLILDYATYLLHDKNLAECVLYMIAYWNVVDLRFREMENPSIRLNIAGIIIATEPNVTPYMDKHKESDTSRYDKASLIDLESYFAKETVTHVNYDIVVGFSPWKLVETLSTWQSFTNWISKSKPNDKVAGIAHSGSTCHYPRQAVVLVRDGGSLVCINPNFAAHEIGHILGATHDPQDVNQGDSDYKSHWKNGYIMTDVRTNKNQMHWSDYSLRSIRRNLQRSERNHCLLKKTNVGAPYRKLFPGKIMNRDQLCKIQFGDDSYSSGDPRYLSDCLGSYCWSSVDKSYMRINTPVAEGSYCGHGKICIEGECVRDRTDSTVYPDL